jgi:hypothetical protein
MIARITYITLDIWHEIYSIDRIRNFMKNRAVSGWNVNILRSLKGSCDEKNWNILRVLDE